MARNLSQLAKFAVQEALALGCQTDTEIADHALYYINAHPDQKAEADRAVEAAVKATHIAGAN